jgi:hypothetical protein
MPGFVNQGTLVPEQNNFPQMEGIGPSRIAEQLTNLHLRSDKTRHGIKGLSYCEIADV